MDESNIEKKSNNSQQQIAGAIIIAGIIIAGAILLKGTTNDMTVANVPISKLVGLNVKSFNTCLASGKFKDKIQADIDDGIKAGVSGTPSSFILKDGKVIPFISENGESSNNINGSQSFDLIMQNIADILKDGRNPVTVQIKPVTSDDHIIGSLDAKIIIIEYSDLDCPFCKVFHNTMHQVIEKNGKDVAWVYRHYPIPQLHPNAFKKAEETECAWEQKGNDAFWKYTDKLFEFTSK